MPRIVRLTRVPWLLLFEVARTTRGHVIAVTSPADRRRIAEIVRRSKGRPNHLTDRDRADLRRIASQLDLVHLARDLGPHMLGLRRRH